MGNHLIFWIYEFHLINRFRNYADKLKNDERFNKNNIKNFEENSDSLVLIISEVLDKLYSDLIMLKISIIPKTISDIHNNLILNFYRTGKRKFLDTINNILSLHKNQTLINIDVSS